jgi:ATP-dependent helicase Lhr and Lhr-like helicase
MADHRGGRNTLIAAPTGSGKTLAAFLAAIDALVRQGVEDRLPDETQVVYVSPLKALSNDIQRNLEAPLAGIREALHTQGLPNVDIRAWVRTGDTPSAERERMRRRPPHIVVSTPESLYILLGSESGRKMLATTRTVIVDEIHALAPNKRGAHLALSLERLDALCGHRLQRIGLSATQKPIETVARFLVGVGPDGPSECDIVDAGHSRARDIALEVPSSPLEAVMSAEVWDQVYDRLTELVRAHRTTLVFVNTRRMPRIVEAVARDAASRYCSLSPNRHF